MTAFVHSPEALKEAQMMTEALFSGNFRSLNGKQIEQLFQGMKAYHTDKQAHNLAVWLVDTGIVDSRRQSREFISNGAISINGEKIDDTEFELTPEMAIDQKYYIVRRGKKNYYLVTIED